MLRKLLPYRSPEGDRGAAMLSTIMVLSALAGLGVTVTAISVSNNKSAGRDREAGGALALAEAGVAQAVEYIRATGVGRLTCYETTAQTNPADPSCAGAVSWANPIPERSQKVTVGPNETYRVWITTIQAPAPITAGPGTYRIHAEGLTGGAPGSRNVTVDVQVRPFSFPIGIFADSIVGGGGIHVLKESIFALNCVNQREKIEFGSGLDMAYGIPPAVHSAQWITTSQHDCASNDRNNIHAASVCSNRSNLSHDEFDQDNKGGDLSGTACQGSGGSYPQSSYFDEALLKSYGYVKGGLSKAQYDALRSRAQAMGTYYKDTTTFAPITETFATNYPNAVVFFDLRNTGGEVHLTDATLAPYARQYCGTRSLILVVLGGDIRLNGQASMVGAIFAPDGNIFGSGGLDLLGTMFAKTLRKLSGQSNYSLEQCFFDNFPGPLVEITPIQFREVDR